MGTYRVVGEAHGTHVDEAGFESSEDAQDYASDVIDGDLDSTVEVVVEASR